MRSWSGSTVHKFMEMDYTPDMTTVKGQVNITGNCFIGVICRLALSSAKHESSIRRTASSSGFLLGFLSISACINLEQTSKLLTLTLHDYTLVPCNVID